ncbi:MAG: DNA repair protein RecO [Chlamydiae bacterium RIFCSPLOWO2_01_FULL_28_7]|nr:MAG: DNA repair protein RecO [Chlamydiae bacterium RIFCSPLOWO2_01_FULL_28_7]
MTLEKTTAITLKTIPYKENSKILKLFSKDHGIISVIINNLSSKKNNFFKLASVFTISEIDLKKSSSEIFNVKDCDILDENLFLRSNLQYIKTASYMINAILSSYYYKTNSLKIFFLIQNYIKNIPLNPNALYLSFLLKILLSYGNINISFKCSICKEQALYLEKGDSLCKNHKTVYSAEFEEDDFKTLYILTNAKSFNYLKSLHISNDFIEKVKNIFDEITS